MTDFDRQAFANEAEKAIEHRLVVKGINEYVDNMTRRGVNMDGLPTIMLGKIAHYAASVARAQALGIDPETLVVPDDERSGHIYLTSKP